MSKFVIKNINAVAGRQHFKQLVIVDSSVNTQKLQEEIDDKEKKNQKIEEDGIFDNYESSLDKKYKSSFNGIVSIMNRVANLQPVADTKFRDITPSGDGVKEYEFKFQDLRVFAIKIFNGKLVILGGYKNSQDKDFVRFRSLKKHYLETLNNKK